MTDIDGFGAFGAELAEFADDLEDIADEIDEAIDEGTRQTAVQIEKTAKQKVSVDDGLLRADIAAVPLDTALYSVGSTKEYAPPTEYGSAPHPITPDTADYLHFIDRQGREQFRKRVEHPGTPAQPFLRPALNQHRSDLVKNIRDEIERVINAHR